MLKTPVPDKKTVTIAAKAMDGPDDEVDLLALLDASLEWSPLAGFVVEGWPPYGHPPSEGRCKVLLKAVCSGMPVVCVGRGNNEGFTAPVGLFIDGGNLTATKACLLLMACLMRFGSLPPASLPDRPTELELNAIQEKLALYQAAFDTH